MGIIHWLLNRGKRSPDDSPADERNGPGLGVQLGVTSHEVTDEELAALKIERKQKAKEWAALGEAEQKRRLIETRRINGLAERERRRALGIKQYQWLWVKNAGHECEACKQNDGKIFSLDNPPNGSHPGDGYCCPDGFCKCIARAVIPGFED